ncbi:MAG: NGG1p interacting factor NIF3 [Candidatus Omnitrophica bacterium]|nr:NGG1p interacting factor NIF3 [Candidatus Omnitrophota bacterium]MDD5575019.1 NGG1p interacting factor NIF3 [Candidatus Omnitrophota bacterium]
MKLQKIYDLIVAAGIETDPRGRRAVEHSLKKTKEQYAELPAKDKALFDTESLRNPYHDSRLLFGQADKEIKTIMAGIDIDTSELLLIDRLNASGRAAKRQKIDLALSHHPQGTAYAGLYEVMEMHAGIYEGLGVPINVAEGLVSDRKKEVERRSHAANHQRAATAARLLGIPFMCAHTPADNHAVDFLQKLFDRRQPQTLRDLMDLLLGLEEYRIAAKNKTGPVILFGKPGNRTGRIFIDMSGGTEGPKDIAEHLLTAGVGTIVGMHVSEEFYKKLQGKNINVIVAGHISSDSLGMNLLLDKLEKHASLQILSCSGFTRVKR